MSSNIPLRPFWLRGLGVGLGIVGIILFKFRTWARIDTQEAQLHAVHSAFYLTIPLAASAFCLACWFTYNWRLSRWVPFAMAVSGIVWLLAWQLMVYLLSHAHG
jgi:hypothetical protein